MALILRLQGVSSSKIGLIVASVRRHARGRVPTVVGSASVRFDFALAGIFAF